MSDSDDTDILLLLPPDIYIHSIERDLELNSIQSEVVGNLIDQVDNLENRVGLIESINSSCGHNSLVEISSESMVFNDCDVSIDNSVINEALACQGDLVSPPLALNACEINSNTESSLDLNHTENGNSKSKETLLREIDSYLNNISIKNHKDESYQNHNSESSTNYISNKNQSMAEDVSIQTPSLPFKRLDLPEVDRLLKEMEATQTDIENKLRLREMEYGLGGSRNFSNVSYRKSFPPMETVILSQDRNHVPFTSYASPLKISDLDKRKGNDDLTSKRDAYLVGSSHNSDSDDARRNGLDIGITGTRELRGTNSFDSRRRFVSPRRKLFSQTDSLPGRKPASGQSSSINTGPDLHKRDYFNHLAAGENPVEKPIIRSTEGTTITRGKPFKYNRNEILSLAELWKNERDQPDDDSTKLKQKLEEEKFRRIHLENTIQDLQKRVLEEQEKLAVAVKVDEGKDKAIGKISEAWKQMVSHWKEIEADRYAMSQAIIKERTAIKQSQEELNKKVERWEKEVAQALDLAAGFKSKSERLENELSSILKENSEKNREFENKLKEVEEQLLQLNEERKLLTDKLHLSEEEHSKEKQLVEVAQKEISVLQETLRKTEAELTVVKEEKELVTTRLREERGRSATLEQQKNSLQQALEETKQKLFESEESSKTSAMILEKNRSDLRAVYQSQLEAVVKEKLEEFQSQLDKAQAAMKAELIEARRLAQERATTQQQALVNSHLLEMKRLERMYKEEIKSLESRLSESERRREQLESGKKEIAHRLHGVMEAQWQQALSIITSEMSHRQGEVDSMKRPAEEDNTNKGLQIDNSRLDSSVDDVSFNKETQATNPHHTKQDALLKYIQMLLGRPPGKPIDSGSWTNWPEVTQSDTVDDSLTDHKWSQLISNAPFTSNDQIQETLKPFPSSQRKPPWK